MMTFDVDEELLWVLYPCIECVGVSDPRNCCPHATFLGRKADLEVCKSFVDIMLENDCCWHSRC